jgi:hypothetical protein
LFSRQTNPRALGEANDSQIQHTHEHTQNSRVVEEARNFSDLPLELGRMFFLGGVKLCQQRHPEVGKSRMTLDIFQKKKLISLLSTYTDQCLVLFVVILFSYKDITRIVNNILCHSHEQLVAESSQ